MQLKFTIIAVFWLLTANLQGQTLEGAWKNTVIMGGVATFVFEQEQFSYTLYRKEGEFEDTQSDMFVLYKQVPESEGKYGRLIFKPENGFEYFLILYFKNLSNDKVEISDPMTMMLSFMREGEDKLPKTVEEAENMAEPDENVMLFFMTLYREAIFEQYVSMPNFPKGDTALFLTVFDNALEKLVQEEKNLVSGMMLGYQLGNYFQQEIIAQGYGISLESLANFKETGDALEQEKNPDFLQRIEKLQSLGVK